MKEILVVMGPKRVLSSLKVWKSGRAGLRKRGAAGGVADVSK